MNERGLFANWDLTNVCTCESRIGPHPVKYRERRACPVSQNCELHT